MDQEDEKLPIITKTADKYFLWNEEDVMKLRKSHRMCGVTVGSLPRKPWQNNVLSLPVLLMPVEVSLCLSRNLACLKTIDGTRKRKVDLDQASGFRSRQEDEQIKIFKKEKQMKSQMFYGRKKQKKAERKWQEMVDEDVARFRQEYKKDEHETSSVVETEIVGEKRTVENSVETEQVMEVTEDDRKYYNHSIRVHIPTQMTDKQRLSESIFDYPSNKQDEVLCRVFTDLWEKGYYITSAEKFGGDFLVYPGDPMRYHSKFIVSVVMDTNKQMTAQELVVYGRLGSAVKKTVVLASVSEQDTVQYVSLSWKNF